MANMQPRTKIYPPKNPKRVVPASPKAVLRFEVCRRKKPIPVKIANGKETKKWNGKRQT
jgi:hypothetical protein